MVLFEIVFSLLLIVEVKGLSHTENNYQIV